MPHEQQSEAAPKIEIVKKGSMPTKTTEDSANKVVPRKVVSARAPPAVKSPTSQKKSFLFSFDSSKPISFDLDPAGLANDFNVETKDNIKKKQKSEMSVKIISK